MPSSGHDRRRSKNHSREASVDLSFESTVQNKAIQPCDLNGFMDYLFYVERRAENLQFFLWYCDYVERWSRLPPEQRQAVPVWGPTEAAEAAQEEAEAAAATAAAARAAAAVAAATMGNTTAEDATLEYPPPTASVYGRPTHSRGPSMASAAYSQHSRRNLSVDTGFSGFPGGAAGIPPYDKPRSNSVASTATAASVSSMASVASHLSTTSTATAASVASAASSRALAASIHPRADNDKLANILAIMGAGGPTAPYTLASSAATVDAAAAAAQPFRHEIDRVVAHYIAAEGPRALPDLFPPERAACLRAARRTTHPSALLPAFLAAEAALRGQSFPQFVEGWCVGNAGGSSGGRYKSARLTIVQVLAALVFLVGVALDVALILFAGGRGESSSSSSSSAQMTTMMRSMMSMANLARLVCLVLWWPALTVFLLAARRGVDLVLYARGRRLLRPWEVEDDGEDEDDAASEAASPASVLSLDVEKALGRSPSASASARAPSRGHRHQASTSSTASTRLDPLRKPSMQALGPRNDPDAEPWAVRRAKAPLYRRLLAELWPRTTLSSRSVAVQHPGVQALQRRAVWTAVLLAGLTSSAVAVASLFVPSPHM